MATSAEVSKNEVIMKKVETLLENLCKKFMDKTLTANDFQIDVSTIIDKKNEKEILDKNMPITKQSQETEENLDEIVSVDYELEFENGEIKVTSTARKSLSYTPDTRPVTRKKPAISKTLSRQEESLRNQMKQLMNTFEVENKKLDQKLDHEKEMIRKKCDMEYRFKLEDEQNYYNGIVSDLLHRLDLLKKEQEEMTFAYEEEKKDIEEFYLKRMNEERMKMKLEMQKKLFHAHKDWEKTKI